MQNGRLTALRIAFSGLLSIVALIGSVWLLSNKIEIPREFWIIVVIGISGVTGVDILAYLIKRKDGLQ